MDAACSFVDRPFAPPLVCTVDLPFPPSTNRLWISTKRTVALSPAYRKWKDQAGLAVVANGSWRKRVAMPAAFSALILLDREACSQRADVDNRIKAVLDWAQAMMLITNDNLCEEVTARWVATAEAPSGCRLVLRSVA